MHAGDVVAVPKRLKHKIGEAQRHDALRNLLAEIVVDAVHLVWDFGIFSRVTWLLCDVVPSEISLLICIISMWCTRLKGLRQGEKDARA